VVLGRRALGAGFQSGSSRLRGLKLRRQTTQCPEDPSRPLSVSESQLTSWPPPSDGVVFKKVGEKIVFFDNVLAESQW
jgi:hypothetical protein